MQRKFTGLLFLILLCSCRGRPFVDYIAIQGDEGEKNLLQSALAESPGLAELSFELEREGGPKADIIISFYSSWEFENAGGDLMLSKTWFVPRSDPLDGRKAVSLASCLEGTETLIPLEELSPPYAGLRVEGLAAGDPEYPLVRAVGIRVSPVKETKRLAGKARALEAYIEGLPKPLVREPPRIAWIVSGGDLMLDRGAENILFEEGPAGIFGATADMLSSADLALVNLEGPVSSRGKKVTKSFNFRFDPKTASALKAAGLDAVLQANNHAFDFGKEAFLDSLTHLDDAGVGVLGAGLTDEEAARPWIAEAAGVECRVYGLASFPRERNGWDGLTAAASSDTPGMLHAGRRGEELLKAHFVEDANGKPLASLDIVLFHGGVEWSRQPNQATRELYTDLVRAGADLVIGSHPHIVQGFEWIEGKPVFWSLGNYVFGGMENTDGGEEGLFIRLGYWGARLVYLEPYALILSHTRTEIAPDEGLETFYDRSRALREAQR
jgi:poly-gamma-glutamate synthesis protein (capsule biosynthesis protein)